MLTPCRLTVMVHSIPGLQPLPRPDVLLSVLRMLQATDEELLTSHSQEHIDKVRVIAVQSDPS